MMTELFGILLAIVAIFVVAVAAILQVVSMALQTFASLYLHSIMPAHGNVVEVEPARDAETVVNGFSRGNNVA
jgi:archaellum biogenesis protein FlaJ (TadC family)